MSRNWAITGLIVFIGIFYGLGVLILTNIPTPKNQDDAGAGCAAAMIGTFFLIVATNMLIMLIRALSGDVL